MFAQTPEWVTLTADVPNLVAWLERMNERPSMKATSVQLLATTLQETVEGGVLNQRMFEAVRCRWRDALDEEKVGVQETVQGGLE